MKLKMKVLSSIILLSTMALSGCINNEKENVDKASGVKISRTGNSVSVMAKDSFEGASIVIDEEIEAKDIKTENTNLVVIKREKDKTIVSIVKPEGEVKAGELLFAVNSEEKLNIEATEIVTTTEANEVYAKEAGKVATRAAGDVLVGDFDNSQVVDVADFLLFAKGYEASYSKTYDIAPAAKASSDSKWADIYSKSTADGSINIFDFIIFGRNFGKINPDISVKTVEITGDSEVAVGSTIALTAKVTYSNSTTGTLVDWKSSDESKATVVNGTVKGLAAGTVVITATKEGVSQTKTITVKAVTENKVTFSWDNVNMYFVITDRFYNGNTANDQSYGRKKDYGSTELNTGTFHGGDIAGLTKKLNEGYFTDLGVNAIWITAPYEQVHGWCGGGSSTKGNGKTFPHYSYHGYYPMDYTEMDKNMGTIEEFRTFVNTAHSKGIRVVMDIVMNHVGYNTLLDMEQYGFGGFKSGQSSAWTPSDGKWDYVWQAVDWDTTKWGDWWSNNWIACGLPTYTNRTATVDQDPINSCLDNLPDVRTETTSGVAAPPFLKKKWGMEASGYDSWVIPANKSLRKDLNIAPAIYIEKWLAGWVEEFGIDGFRCDTAKHVQQSRWKELKVAGSEALKKWRAANPNDPAAKWTDDFWMTGEHWNFGFGDDNGYFANGFNSMINFKFPKDGNLGSIGSTWKSYADKINTTTGYNVLSYINSHDHKQNYGWTQTNMNHATTLLLSPGGVQIYYGDENSRPLGPEVSDPNQNTRSDYQWGSNPTILAHWQKIGQFRRNHVSVGAGTQTDLGNNTYGRTYSKNGVEDKVVININGSGSVAVNVSGIFADGTAVRNAYDGTTGTVSGGKVTFTANNGVILIEKQ